MMNFHIAISVSNSVQTVLKLQKVTVPTNQSKSFGCKITTQIKSKYINQTSRKAKISQTSNYVYQVHFL